jgi:single-stranded-DNA-specific exonuclease
VRAFLGVEASLSGRRWQGPGPEEDRLAAALVQQAGLADPVARVLAARGVPPAEAEAFLAPTLRALMPDPSVLRGMDAAAARFAEAVAGREAIAVFADYDVDGGASAALILTWLRALGLGATLYVPDRIDDGYGPNVPAMAGLAGDHRLIVCVDCGTLSHAPLQAAQEAGADVIVLDHHLGGADLPPAVAVVNPNRADEDGALGHLCAAGVVFLFLVAVNRIRRAEGLAEPPLLPMLDLVALATVADVAPLVGLNRALVRQGLAVMARRERPGLAALADVARLTAPPTAHALGFVLGPRVNAGGRIGAADLGARLLATADAAEAGMLAARLDSLNTERREVEAAVLAAAMAEAEARGTDGPLVWASGPGWHPGVVGIVAARLKEAFDRPAVVIGVENGTGKGSARSVAGIDIGAAMQRLAAEGLIEKGGGHRMAAGLTVPAEGIAAAMARLGEILARQGAGAASAGPAGLRLDGLLSPGAATPDLIQSIEAAGPFGAGAPAPRWAFAAMRVQSLRPVGEGHLQVSFGDGGPVRLDAIAFRVAGTPLGAALQGHAGAAFHLAGRLEIDTWNGRRRVKLRLEDAAPVRAAGPERQGT